MNRIYTFTARLLLVVLLGLSLAGFTSALGEGEIQSTDKFIERLEKEYSDIEDFTARLTISGLEPPLKVEVLAISEPRILRVEYLSPPEMEGQFFLLDGDFLYQYMPAQNLVIKKDLKKSNVPVKAANLTPDYLLKLVKSEELEVNLIGGPGQLYFPWKGQDVLEFDSSISWREEKDSSSSLRESDSTTPISFSSEESYYVLEIVPKEEGYQFARQVIKFDPDSFLPRELITYFESKDKKTVRTDVEEVKTNRGLNPGKIKKLPEDAEVITD
ncbi:MAG: outer membrane lipoprotein carrier protein LolA [Candidatus Bipolaricaulia bacterium]